MLFFFRREELSLRKKLAFGQLLDEQMDENEDSWARIAKKMYSTDLKQPTLILSLTVIKLYTNPGGKILRTIGYGKLPAEDNIVYTNLKDSLSISQKHVYEQTFLVNDSTRKIKWKITDETRNIAGFDCRRANAIIMDSIYVVAYYTDQITTTGGPESFNGLPGMILGLALPHEHITWFATKVYTENITDAQLTSPKKGKKNYFKRFAFNLTGLNERLG